MSTDLAVTNYGLQNFGIYHGKAGIFGGVQQITARLSLFFFYSPSPRSGAAWPIGCYGSNHLLRIQP
jgi:hypothetical protein